MQKFSVLMSVYHKEQPEYLKESIDSIYNQTIKPSEVIIVEDGPLTPNLYKTLDNLCEIYDSIKRIPLEKNGGLGKALNEGLKHCSYNLIARMDSDDISLPDRFEKQIGVFEKFPETDVVSSWLSEFEVCPDNVIAIRKLPEYPFELFEYGKKRSPINHATAMFKKDSILFAGGYRPFPLFEDYYLWVRLIMNGARFYNIQESLYLCRVSSDLYKRRGGLKYGIDEIHFQYLIHRMGYISLYRMIINDFIRLTTRILPNSIRVFIYKRFLR